MLSKLFGRGKQKEILLHSPLKGEVIALNQVEDPTFSSGMVGKGIAVIPTEGVLYAPCNATISVVYDTKHAIGMISEDGVEILLHVGLDTVELEGKFFEALVEADQLVQQGQPLLNFSIDEIVKAGYAIVTPMVIPNSDDYKEINALQEGEVDKTTVLLQIQ